MTDHEPAAAENAALRGRISALSAASLRISASLDLEMVLNEVVESARALTGARYGAIATIDEAGAPQDFVTSGFTADEHRKLVEWPDGPRLFEYFRDLPGPLRLADVPDYVRSLGFSPDDRLPLAQALDSAETVRAEEIVLSVPDGRSVTTLINSTPIHGPDGPDGALASVVVTLQDLAPLRELERMRAEFLGMVSHELRAPLTSIKGSAATVLRASRIFGPAEVAQFFRIIDEQADRMDSLIGDLLDAGRIDAGTLSVAPEPSEVAALVDLARGTFISGGGRHTVRIDLPPDLPRVMADRQRLVQVLNNLLANAARHSPDTAPIRIAAEREGLHVAVAVVRRGPGHRSGPSRPAVPQVHRLRGPEGRHRRRAGTRHLQGPGRGPRVGASGPRAAASASARASPSRSRWSRSPAPVPPRAAQARRAKHRQRCPSWWSTTTRRRCAMSATRWRRRATPRWSPATPGSCRA